MRLATEHLRLILSLSVLAGLLLWETVQPFFVFFDRAGRERSRHIARNLLLAGLNAAAVNLAFVALWAWAAWCSEVRGIGLLHQAHLGAWTHTIAAVLILDGWTYCWHRLNHRLPVLWRFHRTHHSDARMDVTTAGRFHLGEIALSSLLRIPLILLVGVRLTELVVYEVMMFAVVQFHHANIGLPESLDRWLRLFIVTPAMHKVHHSRLREETDSNYSSFLSFWDRLLGTFRFRSNPRDIRLGLDDLDYREAQTLLGLIRTPFINIGLADRPARRYAVAVACGAALLTLVGVVWVRSQNPPDWPTVNRMIQEQFPQVRKISTTELADWLNRNESDPPLLVDVRSAGEYAVSHLASARRIDPDAQADAASMGLDKDTPIVVYCSVGYRSAAFAQRLQDAGFKNVRNLQGSIFQWANEGRPVVRDSRRVYEVHPYDANWGRLLDPQLHPHTRTGSAPLQTDYRCLPKTP